MQDEAPARKGYYPAVDGLRCIAVLSVVWFHWSVGGTLLANTFEAGWMGVWLFFVISGFVITLSVEGPAYAGRDFLGKLKLFWWRRARRILPLCFLVMLFGVVIAAISPEHRKFLAHLPYLLTFTYNFYRISPDYQISELFIHYWSLSVEEQFYLIFPLVYFAASPSVRQRVLVYVVISAPLLRYLVGLVTYQMWENPYLSGNAVNQFSPGHFDAFAVGALIAINRHRIVAWRHSFTVAAAIASAVLVAHMAVCALARPDLPLADIVRGFSNPTPFGYFEHVTIYTALNLFSAALIIGLLKGVRPLVRVLEFRPFLFIGRISFGIYLVHFPLLVLQKMLLDGTFASTGSAFGLSLYLGTVIFVSHLLYKHFERPIIEHRAGAWWFRRPVTATA